MPFNPFEQLLRDKVTLTKKDGTIFRKDVAASVQSNMISIFDPDLPIEVGDHFLRQLPSGLVEDFVVDDPGFRSGLESIPPHFQTKVHRSDRPIGQPQTIITNIAGDNARVNVNSTDNSTNTVTTNSATLFTEMLKAVAQIATKSERETVAATISAMSAAQERQDGTFLSKYQDFIATAANHMTIFAPFLPALSKLLS
jgi:hypothetical protein